MNRKGIYMKVLSLTEPYATLIKKRIKTIETRSWKTNYRGKLYIHASKTKIPKKYKDNKELMNLVNIDELNYGNIICSCDLVDCIEMTDEFINEIKKIKNEYICGIYKKGRYAWILENIKVLDKPIPAKGHLGIWNKDEVWESKKATNNLLNYTKEEYIDAFYNIFGKENVINSKIVGIKFKIKKEK